MNSFVFYRCKLARDIQATRGNFKSFRNPAGGSQAARVVVLITVEDRQSKLPYI